MESPVPGRPSRETGLPPGVEVGPLGKRFVAYLINMSVPVVVSLVLILLLPTTSGALRMTLAIVGAIIAIGWVIVVWYLLAVRAASGIPRRPADRIEPGFHTWLGVLGLVHHRHRSVAHVDLRAAASTQAGLARPRRHCGDDQGTGSRAACPACSGSGSRHAESAGSSLERFPPAKWCSPGDARRPDVRQLFRWRGLRLSRQPSAAWPTDTTAWDGGIPDGSRLSLRRGCRHAAEWTERPVWRQCVRDAAPRRAVRTAAAIRAATAIRDGRRRRRALCARSAGRSGTAAAAQCSVWHLAVRTDVGRYCG